TQNQRPAGSGVTGLCRARSRTPPPVLSVEVVTSGVTSGPFELRVVPYDHPDAVALIDQLQQFYLDHYGGTDDTPVDPAEFAPPRGLFFVAYDGSGDASAPVGCAGWRTHAGNPLLRD